MFAEQQRGRFEPGRGAAGLLGVQGGQFPVEQHQGGVVDGDVVDLQQQHVLVRRPVVEGEPGGRDGQVERSLPGPAQRLVQIVVVRLPARPGQAFQRDGTGRVDALHRAVVTEVEPAAEHRVPGDQGGQGALQGRDVERSQDALGPGLQER